jgi:hypothetical protein
MRVDRHAESVSKVMAEEMLINAKTKGDIGKAKEFIAFHCVIAGRPPGWVRSIFANPRLAKKGVGQPRFGDDYRDGTGMASMGVL